MNNPDVWVFLSAHAVAHACKDFWRNAARVIAIGEATASALLEFGQVAEVPSKRNSEGLRKLLNERYRNMRSLCIVSGEGGRGVLRPWLEADNFDVFVWRVYKRYDLPISTKLQNCKLVVVGSMSVVNRLHEYRQRISRQYTEQELIVPSERIEKHATELGFTKIVRSDDASSVSVVRALETLLQS